MPDRLKKPASAPDPARVTASPGYGKAVSSASLFSVVSWGCAGTAWLARALNSHPDVFCVHGANHYLHSMRGVPPMDGLEYLELLASMAAGHAAVGDVHGISRELIPEIKAKYGDAFAAAVLVRDPLPRLRSQLALFQALPAVPRPELAYIDELATRLGWAPGTLSREDRLKLHAFDLLNCITYEQAVGPVFRIEDLTRKRDCMASLLHHLTSGRLSSPGWWLDYVWELPPLNGHSRRTPDENLSPEDLNLLSLVVTREARDCYRQLGYTIDW